MNLVSIIVLSNLGSIKHLFSSVALGFHNKPTIEVCVNFVLVEVRIM